MEYGGGRKDGAAGQWQPKELVEQVGQPMAIAIVFTLQLYILISCPNTLTHKL